MIPEPFEYHAPRSVEDAIGLLEAHGDEAKLPLSAVLVFPKDDKSATLLKARTNLKSEFRIVVPMQVIEELMAVVFKVKTLLDTFAAFLATSTGAMLLLQVLLWLLYHRSDLLYLLLQLVRCFLWLLYHRSDLLYLLLQLARCFL